MKGVASHCEHIIVIPDSGNPDHIKENLDIFGFELTEENLESGGK